MRTLKSVTIINETEDKTFHEYNNGIKEYAGTDATPDHVNGVYRWVDKYYLNKLVNYGRRLFFEFMIPEPANFYLFRLLKKSMDETKAFEMPLHPAKLNLKYKGSDGSTPLAPKGINSADDIDEINYKFLAAYYGVEGIDIYPEQTKTIGLGIAKVSSEGSSSADTDFSDNQSLVVPAGYVSGNAVVSFNSSGEAGSGFYLFVGGDSSLYNGNMVVQAVSRSFTNIGKYKGGSVIPVSGKSWSTGSKKKAFAVNINVECTITSEAITAWKIKVYEKIMQAYNRKQQEFNEWLQQQKAQSDFDGQEIQGNNPEINRQIEKEELKKRSLELFTGQRWESFDSAVNSLYNVSKYPEILFEESQKEGILAKFFETAFDWENITYELYPYYYGKKANWCSITQLRDNDPIFANFLKAGFARVLVPVTPKYEECLLLFAAFRGINYPGELYNWLNMNGLGATGIGLDAQFYTNLLADIVEGRELKEETGDVVGTYIQKVPTNLVYLASLIDGHGTPDLPDNSADAQIAPNITGISIPNTTINYAN